MDRLASELFGELVADGDIAHRLTVTGPQRFQRRGPGGTPGQLHVGEGVEQLLRARSAQPLAGGVDGFRRIGCRCVVDTGDDLALGVQRPLSVALAVRAAVHLEGPAAAVLQRTQSQLHLAGILVRQNDRFVEEDVTHLRRRPSRGKSHRRVGGARNDNGAVDDVIATATAAT